MCLEIKYRDLPHIPASKPRISESKCGEIQSIQSINFPLPSSHISNFRESFQYPMSTQSIPLSIERQPQNKQDGCITSPTRDL